MTIDICLIFIICLIVFIILLIVDHYLKIPLIIEDQDTENEDKNHE